MNLLDFEKRRSFIQTHTTLSPVPICPEISLYLAPTILPLWQECEDVENSTNTSPPFWAFAWAGGQAMARYLLDHSLEVKNRRILDFAAGCGMAAIAAAQLGARVEAAEIDDFALSAISLNADANNVRVDIAKGNVLERSDCPWDLILAGDVCYEKSMTDHVMAWLRRCAASGSEVLIADPGRAYLPHQGLLRLAAYTIPTSLDLENRTSRYTSVYRLVG